MKVGITGPSKKILIFTAVALLGIIVGSGGTYLALKDDLNSSAQPQNAQAPQGSQPPSAAPTETNLPDGVISPTQIARKLADYEGKQVVTRGIIVELKDNEYILVGQEAQNAGSVKLDVTKINFDKKYIGGYSDASKYETGDENDPSPKPSGPVNVTGTVSKENNNPKITASQISE